MAMAIPYYGCRPCTNVAVLETTVIVFVSMYKRDTYVHMHMYECVHINSWMKSPWHVAPSLSPTLSHINTHVHTYTYTHSLSHSLSLSRAVPIVKHTQSHSTQEVEPHCRHFEEVFVVIAVVVVVAVVYAAFAGWWLTNLLSHAASIFSQQHMKNKYLSSLRRNSKKKKLTWPKSKEKPVATALKL